jgi:predicted transcriptional regulator
MARDFDLFGDPVPEGWGCRGRPPHLVTDEKRNLVKVLLAFGKTEDEIAAALLCTAKTLRKHYSRELAVRDQARAHADAKIVSCYYEEMQKGNVTAAEILFKLFERHDMRKLAEQVAARQSKTQANKLGKKEQQSQRAGEVRGKFAPPPEPLLVN